MGSVLNIFRPLKKVDDYFRNKWTISLHLLDEINRRTQIGQILNGECTAYILIDSEKQLEKCLIIFSITNSLLTL